MTPHHTLPWHTPLTPDVSRKLFVVPTPCFVEDSQPEHVVADRNVWAANGLSISLPQSLYSTTAVSSAEDNTWNSHNPLALLDDGSGNALVSSQMLLNTTQNLLGSSFDDGTLGWTAPNVWHMPQTVAPRATFQPLLSSSPVQKCEPSSPFQFDISEPAARFPDSSPIQISSPCTKPFPFLPTQACHQNYEPSETVSDSNKVKLWDKKQRRQQRRLKQSVDQVFYRDLTPRSKVRDVTVIPLNQFECGYADCVNKKGNRKSFKRQEHRKRHMDTVHEKVETFTCWVSKCHKNFSRSDNLRAHIVKTHGKNSSAQRNRYVATLDEKSKFYDPEWEGELTEDGYPLVPELKYLQCRVPDCGKSYHMEEKLRIHLLQQHGRKVQGSDVSYVASLDEHSDCFDPDWESRLMQDGPPAGQASSVATSHPGSQCMQRST